MGQFFTKDILPSGEWKNYRKRVLMRAIRIDGPFSVKTKEGTLSCQDGYLALDSAGWPYTISASDLEQMYELTEGE